MPESKENPRRQFLKNSSLAALSVAVLAKGGSAMSKGREDVIQEPDCNPTTLDYYGQGPFYTSGPPMMENNQLASETEEGTRLIISGRVLNLACDQYLPNTLIDVWHADDAGAYDNDGYNLRGKTYSNEQGFYLFETIVPGKYLNGATYRPSHIHFKITAPGFPELTTQLYFEGDTSIPGDAAASITTGQYDASERIIPLTENSEGVMEGTWDIMVNGDGLDVGLNDLHLNKGVIYGISPNPFHSSIEIKYGVFNESRVGLSVYDVDGRQVASLEDQVLSAEKYTAVWQPDAYVAAGHYFIALKINDLQVNYMKVIYQKGY